MLSGPLSARSHIVRTALTQARTYHVQAKSGAVRIVNIEPATTLVMKCHSSDSEIHWCAKKKTTSHMGRCLRGVRMERFRDFQGIRATRQRHEGLRLTK